MLIGKKSYVEQCRSSAERVVDAVVDAVVAVDLAVMAWNRNYMVAAAVGDYNYRFELRSFQLSGTVVQVIRVPETPLAPL